MRIGIAHTLRYTFDEPLQQALQRLRLRPLSNLGQTVGHWELLANGMQPVASYIDGFCNSVDLVCHPNDGKEIVIVSRGEVTTHSKAGVLGSADDRTNPWLFLRESPLTRPGDSLIELASALKSTQNRLLQLHELMDIVHDRLAPGAENCDNATDAEAAWIGSTGTCRDHAHVFIAVARRLGIPARFTSGYMIDDGDGIQAVGHSWVEVYVEHLGWIGFNPANNRCPDEHYVRLAVGIDACSAAPVTTSRSTAGGETLAVEIAVTLPSR
ncbi:transglutaminase family protein [Burkholderia orbicola]|uniref:transglutaminase family protein n=1 Tax=Burkholderia orbicola TaxID=2978683 RepID=UPI0039A548E7